VAGLSEEGAEFVLAEPEVRTPQRFEDIFCLHVESNLKLQEDDVVGQLGFWFGLGTIFATAFLHDEAVQEHGECIRRRQDRRLS